MKMNKGVGGIGRSDMPVYDAQCKWLRDTRGLHSGSWFIQEGQEQASKATSAVMLPLVAVALITMLAVVFS